MSEKTMIESTTFIEARWPEAVTVRSAGMKTAGNSPFRYSVRATLRYAGRNCSAPPPKGKGRADPPYITVHKPAGGGGGRASGRGRGARGPPPGEEKGG